jgi:glycine betaine/choline ABC-type transport system substrate-binding protein
MVRTSNLILVLSLALIACGCSSKPHITVGSKNFTEQEVLGEIVAQQIERRMGIEVERTFGLGGTLLAHEALKSGSIDVYPEYTGTALTAILKQPISKDPQSVLASVRQGYAKWRLSWLTPLGFNNTFAMVVRTDMARQQHLTNLTDAAHRREPWKLGVGYEFVERPDGLTGLQKTYGLRLNGDPITMDLGLLYPALRKGNIEMGAGSETDAFLTEPEFTVLADDRHYFPPYECALVVRDESLTQFPKLRAVLEELSGKLSDATMRQLNAAVDRNHRSPGEVARDFLDHTRNQ